MGEEKKKKVLVIGWDAADWKIIAPLIKAGKMPTLAKFVEESAWGNLATLDPPLSPMLWTSMATGVRADKHGILGFVEPLADGSGIRPVASTSRKVKAIWNMLTQKGYKSNVVGWWPSNPVEPINGCMVSNFYQVEKAALGEKWPMPAGTIHPERLKEPLAKLRVHPYEMTAAHILPFIPNAGEIEQEDDKRLQAVGKILAHASSIHAASTYLQREEEWDFMAVYHDAIDHFCHTAMRFHPPQMPGIPDDLYETYKHVVTSGYLFHDMMLERTLEMCDDDTTVMIISDHGFHNDHLRPRFLPKEPAAPAHEHSPFGIIAVRGPGIKKGERIFGATILDITPTLLSLYGLPIGKDMEGKPLLQIYEEPVMPDYIPSWEDVEGEDGSHASDLQEDMWAAKEALDQLVELGYVEAADESTEDRVRKAVNESQYYLARTYLNADNYTKAIPILNKLFDENPDVLRYGMYLAMSNLKQKEYLECRRVVDKLKENTEARSAFLNYLEGSLYLASKRPKKALEFLKKAEEVAPNSVEVRVAVGKALNARQLWHEAESSFLSALALDEENSQAHHGLGISYLRRNRYEEAVGEFLSAVERIYFFPQAHYHLGETLALMEKHQHAAEAFEIAISLTPGMAKAHKWLVKLYEEELNQPEKAKEHIDFLNKNIKGVITIVSGLPRSGTSMMMQMLDKGGMSILTDGVRDADKSNPKGYYEYEAVKRLGKDQSWMGEARGNVVKIVAPLLFNLPGNYEYKIVFMQRDMGEVLRSQQVMLGQTKEQAEAYPVVLANAFTKNLEQAEAWAKRSPNVEIIYVPYAEVIESPLEVAENVNSFLGGSLNIEQMVGVVDPELYRNRMAT
jgi:predicted AlkP superfamily phosphohydrolase/phosphomutase/tetratricopeptide (TPR) repeat protein